MRKAWNFVSAFLYIVWVCRISALFAALALAFVFIPQAQDLLLDFRDAGGPWYWLLFFATFILWLLSLYVAARVAVASNVWATCWSGDKSVTPAVFARLRARYLVASRLVPYAIALSGALIVVVAFLSARTKIPTTDDPAIAERLIGHLNFSAAMAALCAVVLVAILAYIPWPVRRRFSWPKFLPYLAIVDEDGNVGERPLDPKELPRVTVAFRLLTFVLVVLLLGVFAFLLLYPGLAAEIERAALAFLLLSMWIPVVGVLAWLGDRINAPVTFAVIAGLAIAITFVFGDNHGVRSMAATQPTPDERPSLDQWIEAWARSVGCDLNRSADKACTVRPIVVAASGGASRAAFFTGSTLGKLMDVACDGKPCPHDLQNPFARQVFAVSSVSGSTLGAVGWAAALDLADAEARFGTPTLPCRAPSPDDVDDGFFDIPARFFRRVRNLMNNTPDPADELQRYAFDYWFLWRTPQYDEANNPLQGPYTWQDCLEASVAGDYLSPAVSQLVSRDVLPLPYWSDRNVALEDAFDKHMGKIFRKDPRARQLPEGTEDLGPMSGEYLTLWDCQIRHVAGAELQDCGGRGLLQAWPEPLRSALGAKGEPEWRPLIISNGASSMFGNRILTSPIKLNEQDFLDATDAYALLASKERAGSPCGLPIKTAVSNSARFPIISTEGDFVDAQREPDCSVAPERDMGKNRDQIVDGGYFESIGATTAYDVVIRLAERGLTPFVLVVTNDPTVDPGAERPNDTAPEGVAGAFGSPLAAVLQARSARGVMSVAALNRLSVFFEDPSEAELAAAASREDAPSPFIKLRPDGGPGARSEPKRAPIPPSTNPNFAFITVKPARSPQEDCPHLEDISMSWWLSYPVQSVLRANVTETHNADQLAKVCKAIASIGPAACKAWIDGLAPANACQKGPQQ